MTASQIETIARANEMQFKTVIPNEFAEVEYLAVEVSRFTWAYFLMDNTTFQYKYSYTYNAATDKKYNRLPSGFKNA